MVNFILVSREKEDLYVIGQVLQLVDQLLYDGKIAEKVDLHQVKRFSSDVYPFNTNVASGGDSDIAPMAIHKKILE